MSAARRDAETVDQAPAPARTLLPGRALDYSPALDGLRAFAVVGVLLYHAGVSWMPGGYLGVDAFFVLSGFLITNLLIGEWGRTGTVRLAAFWARRARRLLPALFLVIGGVAIYAGVYATRIELSSLRADALAALGYVANWRFVLSDQSYFDQFSAPSPLRHVWSLAIEEQFYLIWPLLLLGLLYVLRGSLRKLTGVVALLAASSVMLMLFLYEPGGDPSRVYYGTDTRAQSLLIGALVAVAAGGVPVVRHVRARWSLHLAGVVAASVVAWMWFTTGESASWLYQGGLTLSAVLVALVIVSASQRDGPLGAVLSLAPLVWLGKISYGVYLWHWPLYVGMTSERTGLDGAGLVTARIGATVVLASASYYLVERPIRFGGLRRVGLRRWREVALAPAVAAIAVVAIVATTTGGRSSSVSVADAAISANEDAPQPTRSSQPDDNPADVRAAPDPTQVLIVGDSVALTLGYMVGADPESNLLVWDRGVLGCGLARGGSVSISLDVVEQSSDCNDWSVEWQRYVDDFRPDVAVILVGAWDAVDRQIDGRWLRVGTSEFREYFLGELEDATEVLSSRGARVVILTTPYFEPPEGVRHWPEFETWRVDELNAIYRQFAAQRGDRVEVIDLNAYVSPGGEFTSTLDGVLIRDDGVHFTQEGSAYLAEWLEPKLRSLDPSLDRERRGSDPLAAP